LFDESRESVISDVIKRFINDDPILDPYLLTKGLKTHFLLILRSFKQVITTGEGNKIKHILHALSHFKGSDENHLAIYDILESVFYERRFNLEVGFFLESQFYLVIPESKAWNRLITLSKKGALQGTTKLRCPLIYAATHKDLIIRMKNSGLLEFLIESEQEDSNLTLLIERLVKCHEISPSIFDNIINVAKKMAGRGEDFELILMKEAWNHDIFAESLKIYFESSPYTLGAYALEFLSRIKKGDSPKKAVKKIIDKLSETEKDLSNMI
jgi:hypothetical protein